MKITALSGGVGAAKLLSGLVEIVPPHDLTVIVNTGDDFRWMGLYVAPDLDTVTYTLAGLENPKTGWGIRDDTFHFLDRVGQIGGDTWFRLGDRDLATHVYRSWRMADGETLSGVTRDLCLRNRLSCRILPMTDDHVPTLVRTSEGEMEFQEYFVRRGCSPNVRGFGCRGIEASSPADGVLEALESADAVFVCPSNPFISIGPILAVPGIRKALRQTAARVLAVSPIVGGRALKGPAAEMFSQLGMEASASAVAEMYRDFLDIFVIDTADEQLRDRIAEILPRVETTSIVMAGRESRIKLARKLLEILA